MIRRPGAPADPFALLGLDSRADLTDDDVRSAWRRIAAATHPDRADGGDPARFAVAAAAYTELRTPSGRGEARAARQAAGTVAGRMIAALAVLRAAAVTGIGGRIWRGRRIRLALRVLAAGGAATVALRAAGPGPDGPALATGALTWLVITVRHDLGPP